MVDDDLTGKRFGRLVVIEFAGRRGPHSLKFYKCKCDCGNESIVGSTNLKTGNSKSCGCRKFNGYNGNAKHGLSKTFEYRVWKGMRRRCRDSKLKIFKHYGGRGIKVCERWDNFENFLADMGKAPSEKHSIEREDVNGNYEPSNCKWIHRNRQSRNRRDTIYITYKGETRTLHEWAEHTGLPVGTLNTRYFRDWPVERVLTEPRKNYALTRS